MITRTSFVIFVLLRGTVCAHAYLPNGFGMSQQMGMHDRVGPRPENCQFSGLHDKVPRQQVLRTWDESVQEENWGFLA